jgi:peptide/nickel transport system ATP-binding protein
MTNDPLLDIQGLHVHYRSYRGFSKVINGVDLRVGRGQKVGLVGEAGCGKTTLMKAVLGILPEKNALLPEGKIFFKGRDLLALSRREYLKVRRRDISMVFQEPAAALNPVFTIETQMTDIIRCAEKTAGVSKKICVDMAREALRQVFIPDPARILKCFPSQLSGGMKQRVCIAAAIVTNRELLIADEPGTALDVTIQDQVHRLINRLQAEKGMSLIMVSHSLGVAKELTDRICVMYAGNVVEEADTPELFVNTLHPYTRGLLEAVPKLTGEKFSSGIYGYIPDYFNVPAGCRFYPRCPRAMDICRDNRPRLTEAAPGHGVACFLYGGKEEDGGRDDS